MQISLLTSISLTKFVVPIYLFYIYFMYMCICMYTCVYVYVYIYIYIHTIIYLFSFDLSDNIIEDDMLLLHSLLL